MAINVISVRYNGGLLPDSIMLTQGYHVEAWLLQPIYGTA